MPLDTDTFFSSSITRHSLSLCTWTWLVWVYVARFPIEYEWVWKPMATERRFSLVPAIYIFIRYTGLIAQTVNLIWTAWLISSPSIHPNTCFWWFWFQSLVIQGLFSAVQYVVMLRVDALYLKRLRVRIVLSVCWLFERGFLMYVAVETFRAIQLDTTCMAGQPPVGVSLSLIATILAVQLIVWGMTLARLYAVGGPKSPLTRQLIRDGALVCASIVAFYIIVVPYRLYVDVLIHNIYAFMISLLSNMGCGVILNLRSLPEDGAEKTTNSGANQTWCLDTIEASVCNVGDEDRSFSRSCAR
ncbi:hypothetical protein FPV67DRAFT_1510928 [Lyophyllum atratum]|nr:hypothetical protein FPV67DRAFT_1510928 [Lyophyllum atratum]